MTHSDGELAALVANDLHEYLASVVLTGPAFAVALWVDGGSGDGAGMPSLGVSIGCDSDLERSRTAPVHRRLAEEQWLRWPSSERWNSGNWPHLVRPFLSSEAEEALQPLRELVAAENNGPIDEEASCGDSSWPCQCLGPSGHRWFQLGFAAIRLLTLPPSFPATEDVLVYLEADDEIVLSRALAMMVTNDPERIHHVFPVWRQLVEAVRVARADEATMAELRDRVERSSEGGPNALRFPRFGGPPPDELTGLLMACGLEWRDVVTWSRGLQDAIAVIAGR